MKFGSANQITLVRAVLVAGLASRVGQPATLPVAWSVLFIAIVAVLLDGVDGWVARRTGTVSAFGTRFDTETDAALILVLAILVWQYGKAGPWVLLSGLLGQRRKLKKRAIFCRADAELVYHYDQGVYVSQTKTDRRLERGSQS